jgi:uncharacterized protein involved in exopolysaccharide biosynthesis
VTATVKNSEPDGRQRGPASHDEIDLAEYAATGWQYRWVILAVVAVAGLLAYLVNRQMTPVYEASVRLLATESRVVDDTVSRSLSVARFRELLESPSLAATVVQEFNLSAPPHRVSPQQFLDSHLTVSEIPDTGILQAAIRLTDPDMLVKLANRYAEEAVRTAEQMNQGDTVYARDLIKQQADQARTRLTEAERELETFRRKTQIELLRKDVDAILQHRPDVVSLQVDIEAERAQLRQAEIELSRQERVRDVRRSLDTIPDSPVPPPATPPATATQGRKPPGGSPVWDQPMAPGARVPREPSPGRPQTGSSGGRGTTRPEPDSRGARGTVPPRATDLQRRVETPVPPPLPEIIESPREESAPRTAPPSAALPLRSELNDPYVNPVYEVLSRDVAQSRARLAGLERRRQQLVGDLKLGAPTSVKLERLYGAETQLAHLIGEYEVARAAYINAASKYEESRLEVTLRSTRLQVLDRALTPERPVAPRIVRNVAASIVLAFAVSVAGVLMFDSARRRRK